MRGQPKTRVAVLFARADSIYKTFDVRDVYDAERDARTFKGGCSVIAHPPCRLWGQMRHFSSAPESEKELALWSVAQVREHGGALEHPASSTLWKVAGLPEPGERDGFGGWTLPVSQFWFGHKAEKRTRLYLVGIEPSELPPIPFRLGKPEYVVTKSHGESKAAGGYSRPEITKAEREHTPFEFARWLIETAMKAERRNETGD